MTDITSSANFAAPDVQTERVAASGDFLIARVFEDATSVLRRHLFTFLAAYVAIHLPVALCDYWIVAPTGVEGAHGADAWPAALIGLLRFFSDALAQAVICYAAYQHLCGRGVSLAESVQACSRNLIPIIWLPVCAGILVALASIALVVPGLVLLTMWYVAASACVVERLGVGASLRRSSELTKGHRWKVFGLLLTLGLVGALAGGVTAGLQHAVEGATFKLLVDIIIMKGLLGMVGTVFMLVVYYDLRVAKEGLDVTRISTVFA